MKKNLVKIVSFVLMAVMIVGLASFYSGTSASAETTTAEQETGGKRVYFAAPLFNEAEKEYWRPVFDSVFHFSESFVAVPRL